MYINNILCSYKVNKEDNKCSKIFRPWDESSARNESKDSSQDCTVSTTTEEEEVVFCKKDNKCNTSLLELDKPAYTLIEPKGALAKSSFKSVHKTHNLPIKEDSSSLTNTNLNRKSDELSDLGSHTSNLIKYQKLQQDHFAQPQTIVQSNPSFMDIIQDPYNPLYPDLLHSNLAQSLGLPANDPLVLESLAQGYALEEYARVLSQEQQAKLLAAKKQRPKKYKCPHCDVGFSNNGQLKGHIRIHTGERPFKCDEKECGKTFTRNEELTRHKRIHSGLRPFPCTHCGKRFGRKDHLKKHARTHFQPRGLYAVPVVMPFEAWASGQANGYPFFPVMY